MAAEDAGVRAGRALAAAAAALAQVPTVDQQVTRALATAKAILQPMSTKPPHPAVSVAPIKVLEISLDGTMGSMRAKTRSGAMRKAATAAIVAMDASLHNLLAQHPESEADREALVKAHELVLDELVLRGLDHPDRGAEDELDRVCKAKRKRYRRLYKTAATDAHQHTPPPLCRLCVPNAAPAVQKRDTTLAIRPWTHAVKILKGDVAPTVEDERFVLGVVLEPEVIDAQQDIYSDNEIRKAAHGFMEHYGHIGLMHKQIIDERVKILESYVAPADFILENQHIKKGTWLMAARIVDDKLWKSVKDGTFNGWSIGGTAVKEPDPAHSALLSLFGS